MDASEAAAAAEPSTTTSATTSESAEAQRRLSEQEIVDAACCRRQPAKVERQQQNANTGGDQVALITGCASGIGRGTALAFAALNYRLVLVDKQPEGLASTAAECVQKSPKAHKVSSQRRASNQSSVRPLVC